MNMGNYQKNRKILSALGITMLAASVFVILYSGSTRLTRELVEQRLQQFAGSLSREAQSGGREAHFSYGTVTMQGWGFDKRATVRNISLDLAEKSLLDTTRWSLSIAKMQVLPAPAVPGELMFVFTDPVNVIENGQWKGILTFSSPLHYGYFDGHDRQQHIIIHSLHLPEQITLAPAPVADSGNGEKWNTVTVSYDPNPVWYVKIFPDSGRREAAYALRNVKIAASSGAQETIAAIDGSFEQKPGADRRPQRHYRLTLVDVSLRDGAKSGQSYTLSADLQYAGDTPWLELRHFTPVMGNANMMLNQLLLAGDDFRIKASGQLSLAADDPLPSGHVDLAIDHVQALLMSDLVPEASRPMLAQALQKITGQPDGSLSNIDIPLKREKNGVLYVGNITFEELAASVVGTIIRPATQPAPPAGINTDKVSHTKGT